MVIILAIRNIVKNVVYNGDYLWFGFISHPFSEHYKTKYFGSSPNKNNVINLNKKAVVTKNV